MNLHIILIPLLVVGGLVALWIWSKARDRRGQESFKETAKKTVGDILEKVEKKTKEELKDMKPDEKAKKFKKLYGGK